MRLRYRLAKATGAMGTYRLSIQNAALRFAFLQMCPTFATPLTRFARSLPTYGGGKWGVWGEGGEASGSPHNCSAKLHFW